jgi:putative ABC transport system permease protein
MAFTPRWQKVLSDLWKNKTRTLLIVASIAVGLLAIGVIMNLYFWLNEDMSKGFEQINPANIQIQTNLVDMDMVKHVQKIPGVKTVEGAREFSMQILTSGGNWESLDLQYKDFAKSEIGQVVVTDGTWPPAKNQIVLSNHKLSDLGFKVGDWVTLKDSQGNQFRLQVSGIVKDQMIGSASGAGGFFTADPQGYIDEATLKALHTVLPDDFNKLYITLTGDAKQASVLNQMGELIYQDLKDDNVTIINFTALSPVSPPNSDLVNAMVGILLLLTVLIVFLSGFLITNTLQFLLTQQMQQVGIMKSIGATRSQIIMIYVALIAIFGMIALLITVPLTYILTDRLMDFLSGTINFTYFGPRVNFIVLGMQVFIAMVVPQVAASSPILKGTRLSVQEALSGIQQQATNSRSKFTQFLGRLKGFSRPNLIAIRNVFRNRGRLILTLVTLSLGGAVFISVFSVRISLNNYISQLSQYFLADLNITFTAPQRIQKIENLLYTIPEIKHVEAWNSTSAAVINPDGSTGENVEFLAVPNDSTMIQPIMVGGRWLDPRDQDAIALDDQFENVFPNLRVGDTISLIVNDKKTNFEVVGFFQLAGKLGGLASYVNLDYFNTLPGQVQNQSAIYRVVGKGTLTPEEQNTLAAQAQSLLDAQKIQVGSISTGNRINTSSTDGFNILTTFLLVLAILIGLVGAIGLTGTMSMNIMERTREIGIMRSIGASDKVLTRMVLIEGLIVGWLSWGIGALLSFPISALMSNSITLALFGAPSSLGFSITGFAIWFVIVSVLSVLSSLAPARSATRLTIREVLAYE